jgi:hypothetical protein
MPENRSVSILLALASGFLTPASAGGIKRERAAEATQLAMQTIGEPRDAV